jgi:hypothetical protein
LLGIASRVAPAAFRTAVVRALQRPEVFRFEALEGCWSPELGAAILEGLRTGQVPSHASTLRLLIGHRIPGALKYAVILLRDWKAGNRARSQSVAAAEAIVDTQGASAWRRIGPMIVEDQSWGRQVLDDDAFPGEASRVASLAASLADEDLGQLAAWMLTVHPPSNDSHGITVGPLHHLRRDEILSLLKSRGTLEAVGALRQLESQFPTYRWLWRLRHEAEQALWSASWHRTEPGDLMRLVRDHERRVVHGGASLLDLLTESLVRVQTALRGDGAIVRFLWNELPDKTWRPKTEEDLSDWIADRLKLDLGDRAIVVNREVNIRRRTYAEGATGQRTDIRVDLNASPDDALTAFIEVKGNWHQEVSTAMKGQLVERYLKDNQSRFGLYLVGWFWGEGWNDTTDNRRGHGTFVTLHQCRDQLDAQALAMQSTEATPLSLRAHVLDCTLPE